MVVRNSTKKPIPHPTLIEAAQLAAYFSQAKKIQKSMCITRRGNSFRR
jgi:predicted ribosome quality control (RQC) complex YloA/Tae2 family protein